MKGRAATAAQALANIEQTVAVALEETECAWSQFTRSFQEAPFLTDAVRNVDAGAKLSRLGFDAGSDDLWVVPDAERQALTALVAVYKSIGDGWAG